MVWDLLMGESKKQMSLNVIQDRNTLREGRTIHIGFSYWYSVETDFNEHKNDNHSIQLHKSLNIGMKVPWS